MKEIQEILQRHNFELDISHIQNIDMAILKVSSMIFYSGSRCKNPRFLLGELQQLKRRKVFQTKLQDPEFQKHLSDVLTYEGFCDNGNHITYTRFIPPSMVAFDDDNYRILDPRYISNLVSLGYGIKTFWIEKSQRIQNVYCTGKHPNLNPISKSFCIGRDIMDKEFSLELILSIIESLSCFNLSDTFLEDQQRAEIMEAINAETSEKQI